MEELNVVEALRLDELIGRKVRHFKGKEYLVLGTVIHTETLETMVLYKALDSGPFSKTWYWCYTFYVNSKRG